MSRYNETEWHQVKNLLDNGWIEEDGKFFLEGSFMCSKGSCRTFVPLPDALIIQGMRDELAAISDNRLTPPTE